SRPTSPARSAISCRRSAWRAPRRSAAPPGTRPSGSSNGKGRRRATVERPWPFSSSMSFWGRPGRITATPTAPISRSFWTGRWRPPAADSALAREQEPVTHREQAHAHALVVADTRVELPDRPGVGVVGARICHLAAPQRVVDRDDAAGAEQAQAALVVVGVALLVRVDVGKVEGARAAPIDERLQGGRRGCDVQLDLVGNTSPREVATGDLRVLLADVASDDAPVGRQTERDTDGAVAGENAHLDRPPRAQDLDQQAHELGLLGRGLHGSGGQPTGFTPQLGEHLGFPQRLRGEVVVDLGCDLQGAARHGPSPRTGDAGRQPCAGALAPPLRQNPSTSSYKTRVPQKNPSI